jgi:hypothetical protein
MENKRACLTVTKAIYRMRTKYLGRREHSPRGLREA